MRRIKMAQYKVVEKFVSINGEGILAGQLAVFIRFQGCNLACSYCDTSWANEHDVSYTTMTENEIYQYIKETGIKNVTLTGGEPLLVKDLIILLNVLLEDNHLHIEIETNGSVDLSQFTNPIYYSKMNNSSEILSKALSFTMDYKLAGSGMEHKMRTTNFELLKKTDTVKFVVSDIQDLEKTKEIIEQYHLTKICHVYISPVFGKITPEEIVNFLIINRLNNVNMQLQMHKVIWDPDKRGV